MAAASFRDAPAPTTHKRHAGHTHLGTGDDWAAGSANFPPLLLWRTIDRMAAAKPSVRLPPMSESPWFWLYLFAAAGLVALVLAGPRYIARQVQLERNLQGHQRAVQVRAGQAPQAPLTPEGRPQIQLTPLYAILAVLLLLGWVGLWYSRFRLTLTDGRAARETARSSSAAAEIPFHSDSPPGSPSGAGNSP